MKEFPTAPEVELGKAMKVGMRRLAASVSVLATRTDEGQRFAITVSSVTSVSDSPASLLVCINRQLALEGHVATPDTLFTINVLSAGQEEVSNLCAGFKGDAPRFSRGDWQESKEGVPYLADAEATFFCRSDKIMTYGTHHIVVARIVDVSLGKALEVDPLIYVDGGYGSLAPR